MTLCGEKKVSSRNKHHEDITGTMLQSYTDNTQHRKEANHKIFSWDTLNKVNQASPGAQICTGKTHTEGIFTAFPLSLNINKFLLDWRT